MSSRNTRQGKARRRAERERQRRSMTLGQEPGAVETQPVQVAPRPEGPGPRNSDEHDSAVRSDAGGVLIAAEPGEADLDTSADPDDFGDLDPDDADLQATLTVLAVLEDDISEADLSGDLADDLADGTDLLADGAVDLTDGADGLADGTDGPEVPDEPEDLGDPAAGQQPAEDEEILVLKDDDDDLPAPRAAVTVATADPVKDYLKQIGKVPLLSAEQEVDLAKRIEAGL